jgi:hypothetical protein
MNAKSAADLPPVVSGTLRRKRKIAAVATLAVLSSCLTSCTKTQIGLSTAAIAAALVATTVGVTLAVQHSRHTLQGCIVSGANGLELRISDGRLYTVRGDLADVNVGDKLKLHGSRAKKIKGDSNGAQVFVVEKINRDYGPCPVLAP